MISIIIPTYNEEGVIGKTIRYISSIALENHVSEIIVADGGSTDNTLKEAQEHGAFVVKSAKKGRAPQMNEGARHANGSVLYFLHADSIPPKRFGYDITEAIKKAYTIGCFRLRFDHNHWFLKANAWFTRFDINAFRFGDQSLFVAREVFIHTGGFCEKHLVMEDQEIILRLRRHAGFTVLPNEIITSSRKYITNGVYRMQGIFYLIYFMYQLGYSQEKLVKTYRKLIKQDKV